MLIMSYCKKVNISHWEANPGLFDILWPIRGLNHVINVGSTNNILAGKLLLSVIGYTLLFENDS